MQRIPAYSRSYAYRLLSIRRFNEQARSEDSSTSESEASDLSEERVDDNIDAPGVNVDRNSERGNVSRAPSIASQNSRDIEYADNDIDNQSRVSDPESDLGRESSDSDSEISEEENNRLYEFIDGPLYDGAPITVAESLLSILSYYLRFGTKDVALEELFNLIMLHCPPENSCVRSIYQMQKILLQNSFSPNRFYHCRTCQKSLLNSDSVCDCGISEGVDFFLTIPIKAQLQEMYKRPGFCELLNYKNVRRKLNPENYEDIQDGIVHKFLSQPGRILSYSDNLSFFWNTDGFTVFHSSFYDLWPFFLTNNELPPKERFKQENLILAGLWFGKAKPNPNLFMEGFSGELRDFLFNGFDFETTEPGNIRHVHGIVIGGTADLPAKAAFMNLQQFNGTFGCQVCEAQCKHIGHVPTYPYQENVRLRTTEETVALAQQVSDLNLEHLNGVKGPSTLDDFVHDYVGTTVVDDMHSAYLGQTKNLINRITKSKYKEERWSLHNRLDVLEERMSEITPPNFVHRLERPLSELEQWKAAEFKNFLFYYALPLFHGLLPDDYFENLKLFVVGMYLLSKQSVSDDDIDNAEKMLNQHVREFEVMYGPQSVLPNSHMILHLPSFVRKFGPLQIFSMFHYEDLNGKMKSLIHGTRWAESQVIKGLKLFLHMAGFKRKFLTRRSAAVDFIERMGKSKQRRKLIHVTDDFKIVGLLKCFVDADFEVRRLLMENRVNFRKIQQFNRILKKGVYFESVEYTRTVRTNSTYIQFISDGAKVIGKIEKFIKLDPCECDEMCRNTEGCQIRYYAIVDKLALQPIVLKTFDDMEFDYGFRCWFEDVKIVIDIEKTEVLPCFLIDVEQSEKAFVFVAATSFRDK